MCSSHLPPDHHHGRHRQPPNAPAGPAWIRVWVLTCTYATGILSLIWLLLRTGPKPSRLTYPCQQAAFGTATAAFGVPLVATVVAARRRIAAVLRTPKGILVAALGLVATGGLWGYWTRADIYQAPEISPPPDYRAQLFHVTDCPEEPIGSRFVGLDNLMALMGREGLKFYRSDVESLTAGPEGIIGADDVVVIKINYQWTERGGTNVDLLRGLIRRVIDHPDVFTGEVVVCENSQFNPIDNFDRASNNAQATSLSPHDAVVEFQGMGHTVSHYDWTIRRNTSVNEYANGDMTDGYVVYDYDAQFGGRVSYPKFRTTYGTYISLKYGVWDDDHGTYDRDRLKFINLPVLKSHHATYGVTACVKHYMGVVTGNLSTNSHGAIRYGILGALMGEIQIADLNILDCIWVNANPYSGPQTTYAGATRRNELVAAVDPVAADIWAASNILIPAFIANGYSPPWPYPSADPDNPASEFRTYLDNSMSYLLSAGYSVTNDLDRIDVVNWNGAGDADGDSDVDQDDYALFESCMTGPKASAIRDCLGFDLQADHHVDLRDVASLQKLVTGPGSF